MMKVFLSASIPDPRRNRRYHETADIIAIRDAVRALATVVLPQAGLYWGGHPAITPLIRVVAQGIEMKDSQGIHLYQSAWYSDVFPEDNAAFENYKITPKANSESDSINLMRTQMLSAAAFDAGIFIGGMEGVEQEFHLFRDLHPRARLLPIATTGAAARIIFDKHREQRDFPAELATEYAYPSLFRRLLAIPDRPR